MPLDPLNYKELGKYYAMSQVGLEMAAPVGIGLALDHFFGWSPWCAVAGVVLGFVGGLFHLVKIVNRQQKDSAGETQQRRGPP
jgi:F0F1-type ATP synthase assembly protein I